jgi:hypothetical protein
VTTKKRITGKARDKELMLFKRQSLHHKKNLVITEVTGRKNALLQKRTTYQKFKRVIRKVHYLQIKRKLTKATL